MKIKDEIFSKSNEWKEAVEKRTWKRIKCVRKDNGLENLRILCRESGIKKYMTSTYTRQQNGIPERMSITILDKVRCMFVETGLG